MLLKGFFISLFQTVAIVCFINGLFLYVYLSNNSPSTSNENVSVVRAAPVFSLRNFISFGDSEEKKITENATLPVLSIQEKQLKIIYYKTHKTASTTVGSIIFRLGAQHGAHFLPYPRHYYSFEKAPSEEVDITLNHHYPGDYDQMMKHYKQLVPKGKFLSVLREPTRRYLSVYHYYVEPNGKSFQTFLKDGAYTNGLVRDFGIWNQGQFDGFMKNAYSQFIFLMTEKLDESLLMLKNAWGWTLQDILYIKLNDACKKGINYARKPMSCRPQFGNLTAEQLHTMEKNNQMDIAFYARALNDTNAALALQPPSFWSELAVFKQMQLDLQSICGKAQNKTIPSACTPYYWDDAQYEAKIRAGDGQVPYPVFSVHFGSF